MISQPDHGNIREGIIYLNGKDGFVSQLLFAIDVQLVPSSTDLYT